MTNNTRHGWMRRTLQLAAVYNILWGAWVVLRPNDLFELTNIAPPNYPGIWQCVGMIVGVYGMGYAIASRDPLRHWPITLVGLLGKILGPIGFAWTLLTVAENEPGYLPAAWGLTILTNDLIWWVPFTGILLAAYREATAPPDAPVLSVSEANVQFPTVQGPTIAELSRQGDVLVLFLRHSGCTFCREALEDLAKRRTDLQAQGVTPVVVHMSLPGNNRSLFESYGLGDVHQISDPSCRLYRAYELGRGSFRELLAPSVWWRGFLAAIVRRQGLGKLEGDGFQMPGVFLVRDNAIVKAFRHKTAADRPDVCEFATVSPADLP